MSGVPRNSLGRSQDAYDRFSSAVELPLPCWPCCGYRSWYCRAWSISQRRWSTPSSESNAKGSNIHSFGQALWWAVVTVTTVGYGDKYPVTAGGRGVAVVLMLVGIGLIGVLTATVASYFVEQRADDDRDEIIQRLDRIEVALAALASGQTVQPLGIDRSSQPLAANEPSVSNEALPSR